jgi:hypothetical protein
MQLGVTFLTPTVIYSRPIEKNPKLIYTHKCIEIIINGYIKTISLMSESSRRLS